MKITAQQSTEEATDGTDGSAPQRESRKSPGNNRKRTLACIAAAAVMLIVIVAAILVVIAPVEHEVAVEVEGSGYVSGAGTYEEGSTVTLTAVGTNGEKFYRWGDGVTNAKRVVTVDSDVHLKAYFSRFYDVSVYTTLAGAGQISGGGTVRDGQTVTLTAETYYGYEFSHWEVGGRSVSTSSTYTFRPASDTSVRAVFEKQTFTVSCSMNYGDAGYISGGGTYQYLDQATLRAYAYEGFSFQGWYRNGSQVSTSSVYSLQVEGNAALEARYGIIHDASFTSSLSSTMAPAVLTVFQTHNVRISSSVFTAIDKLTGQTLASMSIGDSSSGRMSFGDCCWISVRHDVEWTDGYTESCTEDVLIDGYRTNEYSWMYEKHYLLDFIHMFNNQVDDMTLSIRFSEYIGALADSTSRWSYGHFVSTSGSALGQVVSHLKSTISSKSLGESDALNYVLRFAQCIPYSYDSDSKGEDEYARFPVETLYDYTGDCEDTAILLTSLYTALGYSAILIDMEGHMAAGVASSKVSGDYCLFEGVRYYYCETATDDSTGLMSYFNVGEMPGGVVFQGVYYNNGSYWARSYSGRLVDA